MGSVHGAFTLPATLHWSNWLSVSGTCYVWRMMRGGSLTTHFEPLHKLRAHAGDVTAAFVYSPNKMVHYSITIHQQLHFLVQELHGGMRLYCA